MREFPFMTDWANDVDRLLFDGEAIEESMDVGSDRLVVTTHRLLAFMPTGDGPRFEAIHRPNVVRVDLQAGGENDHLTRGVKAGILGFFLLAGGATVSLDGVLGGSVDTTGASQVGVGEIVGLLGVLQTILNLVDDALLVAGLVAFGVAAVAITLYARSRHTDVVVRVAGGDDVHLTGDDVTETSLVQLRRALGLRGSAQREEPR